MRSFWAISWKISKIGITITIVGSPLHSPYKSPLYWEKGQKVKKSKISKFFKSRPKTSKYPNIPYNNIPNVFPRVPGSTDVHTKKFDFSTQNHPNDLFMASETHYNIIWTISRKIENFEKWPLRGSNPWLQAYKVSYTNHYATCPYL